MHCPEAYISTRAILPPKHGMLFPSPSGALHPEPCVVPFTRAAGKGSHMLNLWNRVIGLTKDHYITTVATHVTKVRWPM